MSILGSIGNVLGDVAHGAEKFGEGAIQAAGQPAPTYSVDPTTGQTVTTQGKASAPQFFHNMLMGALAGAAAASRAHAATVAGGLGAGFEAQRQMQQQNQDRAQQQAQQQFSNEMAAMKENDYRKYLGVQTTLMNSEITKNHSEGALEDEQTKHMAGESYQSQVDGYRTAGDDYLGAISADQFAKEGTAALSQLHPEWAQKLANHELVWAINPDTNELEVYDTAGSKFKPIDKDVTVQRIGPGGKMTTQVYKAGTISRDQANLAVTAAAKANQDYLLGQARTRAQNAAADASEARATRDRTDTQFADEQREEARVATQLSNLAKGIWQKDLAGNVVEMTTPEAKRNKAIYDQLQQKYAKLTGAQFTPDVTGQSQHDVSNSYWMVNPQGQGGWVSKGLYSQAVAKGYRIGAQNRAQAGAAQGQTAQRLWKPDGSFKDFPANDPDAIAKALQQGWSDTAPAALTQPAAPVAQP